MLGIYQTPLAGAADMLRYGADLRIRQEAFDEFPEGGPVANAEWNYFRFRPRAWFEVDPTSNITFRARIVNETREWNDPDVDAFPQSATYEWSDEWVFDHLYVDLKSEAVDLRIGRQDLIYGTGKVILEGTPEDGSRTIYFNAVRAVFKGLVPDSTLDVFGIYNPNEDDLALDSSKRDLTGYTGAYDDMDEYGGGLYLKNKSFESVPFEAYLIYKGEEEYARGAGAALTEVDALDLGTAGARIMPKFSDALSANVEAAYQLGERGDQDVSGYMLDASLFCKLPSDLLKPVVDGGVYWISGDDPDTQDDEGWNPLWARYPQASELYVYLFPRGRWSNTIMPNAGVAVAPSPKLKLTGRVNYLMAEEEGQVGEASPYAGGDERGWLYVAKAEYTLAEKLLRKGGAGDKLTGHVWLEVLDPGDYYVSDDTAYFARWEFLYAF